MNRTSLASNSDAGRIIGIPFDMYAQCIQCLEHVSNIITL